MPGPPIGAAGDQHCLVYEVDGHITVHLAEVVEAGEPNRVATRWPTISPTLLSTSTLTPTHTGTTFTSRMGLDVARGTVGKVAPEMQKAMAESKVRLKACVESGARFFSGDDRTLD